MKSFLSNWLNWQLVVALVFIALAASVGATTTSDYMLQVMVLAIIYAAVGTAWSIAGGLAGLLLLGYISFFGMGAYVNGVLATKYGISPWLNMPIAAIFCAGLAWAIAAITLRFGLSEDYFAMFTVALSQVIKYAFLNWEYVGQATGIYITVTQDNWAQMSFIDRRPYLYIALGLLLLVVITTYAIQRSRWGYYLAAVRENGTAAEALGINVSRVKTASIIVSGALAGAIGSFYCQFATFIDPKQAFNLATNFEMLLGPVLGGRLSIIGPLFGASVLKPVQDVLRGMLGGEADALYLVLYGGALMVGILLLPKGISSYIEAWHRRKYSKTQSAAANPASSGVTR